MKTSADGGLLTIGAIAHQTGCNVPTIRYYEQIGLIPPAKRRSSRHRVYDDETRELLTFIRRCRAFGFSIEQIRALLSLAANERRDCVEMRDIAQEQLSAVRTKLLELHALERSLERFVQSCTETCVGGPASKCSILKDLQAGCCG